MTNQSRALLRLSVRGFHRRLKISLIIALGTACMTGALLPILSLAEGLRLSFLSSRHDDRVRVMAGDVSDQWAGARESASRLPDRLAHLAEKAPMLSGPESLDAEVETWITPTKIDGEGGLARLHGLGPHGLRLFPELKLISGRTFRPGSRDLMVGALAAAKFSGMTVGNHITLAGASWAVTGIYRTGTQLDGDILASAQTLKAVLKRSEDSQLLVRLTRPNDFAGFKTWLARRAGMPLLVQRESDYYKDYWKAVPNAPFVVAYILGVLFGSGALAGTLQATSAAAESRGREIALLRAIGFGGRAIACTVLLESLLLSVAGALLGTFAVWLWLDGYVYNAQGVFRVTVNEHMAMIGVAWALVVAGAGALTPVYRLATMTVTEALRIA